MPSKQILIVDDDQSISSALAALLTQAGYAVSVTQTGVQALAQLTPGIDLVILDVMMPEMDGYETCRKIRQSARYIPILMLTARDGTSDKVLGLELGADHYLTKPFEPSELLAHVRALFRTLEQRNQGEDGQSLIYGPLHLWSGEHRVEVNAQAVELTPTEFELLHLFMRHPGQAFGRETLLREVWGYDFSGDTRTVDVHIQRLRSKIEIDPAHPQLIHTMRGFGYRLFAPSV